jgi:hypothetical protein
MIAGYNKPDPLPPGAICGDFNRTKTGPFRVQSLDLSVLIGYYNNPTVPECSGPGSGAPYDQNPVPNTDYNFWVN